MELSEQDRQVLDTYRRARPQEWSLTAPALLVVDVVDSFVGRDVPVPEAQKEAVTACGENAWRALGPIRQLLDAFRARSLPVAFSTIREVPPLVPGPSRGVLRTDHVHDEVAPVEGELVLPKAKPSIFFGTPILTWLTERAVREVVVVGGATSGCVRASAVDAFSHGFSVLLPSDGSFDRVQALHENNLADLDLKYARVTTAADVVARLPQG